MSAISGAASPAKGLDRVDDRLVGFCRSGLSLADRGSRVPSRLA